MAAYQTARRVLVEQFGIEPGEELQQLQRAILAQDPSLRAPETVTPETVAATPAAAPAAVATPAAAASAWPTSWPPTTSRAAAEPAAGDQASAATSSIGRPERRVVTILAVSLRTPRPDDADPEDLWTDHDRVAQQFHDVVEQHGGIVHSDLGETLLATFGARRAHADDPARAVRAALALIGGETSDPPSAVAVGVDTGEAVVQPGPDARPRATGGVVHAATDLAARASGGTIHVGEGCVRVTDQVISYRPVERPGGQDVRGWEVAGTTAGDGPADAEAVMVGRERELAMLTDVLDRARDELEPQLVTVLGAPGIGKTRLLAELRQRDADNPTPATWYAGRSLPYGDGITYWALAEIIKQVAGILATDDAEAATRKLHQTVAATFGDTPEAAWADAYLARLIRPETAPDQDAGWRREAFAAWSRFFEMLAAAGPLVLVLEDLHWADDAMLDFAEHLIGHAEAVPVLVVCLAWPELLDRRSGWAGSVRNATTVSLAPLPPPATERLLDELLARSGQRLGLEPAHRSELLAGSGGNPLFVEEYVRMLRSRAPRAAGAREPPVVLLAPETIQLLISARLDDLEPGDRALLADAAVLGHVVWADALTVVSGQDPTEVTTALRRLARREFLRRSPRSSIPGQTEYAFRHGLIRDVAYGRLLRADRADRHRRAAEWLEAPGDDRAADLAELIAHHYQQAVAYRRASRQPGAPQVTGDLASRAAVALKRAGDRAFALAAYRAALRYYDQALQLWPVDRHAGEPGNAGQTVRPKPVVPGWAQLRVASERLRYDLEQLVDEAALAEARDELLAAGDQTAAATAELILAWAAWIGAQAAKAAEHQQRARSLLRTAPASAAKARALTGLSHNIASTNRYAEALDVGHEALELIRALKLTKLEAGALAVVGAARTVTGDRAGLEDLWQGMAALEQRRTASASHAYVLSITVLGHIGDLQGGWTRLHPMRHAAKRSHARAVFAWAESIHALELYTLGQWDDAHALTDALIERLQAAGGKYLQTLCRCVRAKIRLGRGDLPGAVDDAGAAFVIARRADEHILLPAAAVHGSLLLTETAAGASNRRAEADRVAAEARDHLPGRCITPWTGAELPDLLTTLGHTPDIDDRLVQVSPWLQAMVAFRDGRPEDAADVYAAIGDRAAEALARLRAGERLAAADRAGDAAAQLTRARAFYSQVRATRFLDQIAMLLSSHGPG